AGADEPQADTIASLFTRRAFPGDPAVQLMADIRALNNTRRAIFAALNPDKAVEISEDLAAYGWPMVAANDAVLAMTQDEIDSLSDDDIIAHRFDTPDRDIAPIMELGKIFSKITADITTDIPDPADPTRLITVSKGRQPIMTSSDIDLIAQGAAFMAQNLAEKNEDPALQAMAARTARAAHNFSTPHLA
ncbi:MAG: hypothetical protein KKA05_08215, partial [Alphaproteobacteria bacterium]|nr:hypothetical protein [Alphaproteobacteria bacterium]